jgi:anthranilate synthase component I
VNSRLDVKPDIDTYRELAADWPRVPVWAELMADVSTPVGVFPALAGVGPGVLLESVERSERWGRYSFVAGDPVAILTVERGGIRVEAGGRSEPGSLESLLEGLPSEPLPGLKEVARRLRAPHLPELPPLTGGLVGFPSYEASATLDGSPHPTGGDLASSPAMQFLVADRAVVFDHWRQRLLVIAHGGGPDGYGDSVAALHDLVQRLRASEPPPLEPTPNPASRPRPTAGVGEERFRAGVARAREHILAGDIFQAVLSRRLSAPAPAGGFPVYRRLRVTNPAPYMFFLRAPGLELAGSSPEPLVRVDRGRVSARPIAGTRPRGGTLEEDRRLERELLADPKERAEHAMLVDLARNDLGRVCRPGTVEVTELMAVERFSRVMHIVSTVEGDLREDLSPLDALAAAFPAGTVTGAPKRRAMEIIAEEETAARGPYAGAVGYLTFAGDLDFCITIRTAVVTGGTAHVQSGAGVVADSDPDRELAETVAKASAVLAAVDGGSS